ncbi:hypothetical protein AAG589_20955 [Isoptericola sp. F-RaC21]|uniref:hypothetical protein n=1 Tax=Isoptericola sp. F-RaC21 TaxID=3141452 RepID=UPI00315B95CD
MTGEGRRDDHQVWQRPEHGDKYWPARKPLNAAETPRHAPVRPQGSYAVIVRLLWDSWEELVPGTANRWADGRVLVTVKPPNAPSNVTELLCWLRQEDVYRTIPRRPRPGGSAR